METAVRKYQVHKTDLYPLSQMDKFKVAKEYPDVRGWDIVGGDGEKLGKVKDLIADVKHMKIRYLDVDLKHEFFEDGEDYQILLPLGVAILNRDDHNVIVTGITRANLANFPLYKREPIYVVRSYETAVQSFFENRLDSPQTTPTTYNDEFYHHRHFDDSAFYRD
ncbi:MAG: hypothetical protein CMO01_29600 [Thalassobius sp.]|nr:hypothetical protein [Thalassovita sp.]